MGLDSPNLKRRRLDKRVWGPSDLARIERDRVLVTHDALLEVRGRVLQQLLEVFVHSRVPISGIALGTARGDFDLAVAGMLRRRVFGRPLCRTAPRESRR